MGKVAEKLKEIEMLPLEQQRELLMIIILQLEQQVLDLKKVQVNPFDWAEFYKQLHKRHLNSTLKRFIIKNANHNVLELSTNQAKRFSQEYFVDSK